MAGVTPTRHYRHGRKLLAPLYGKTDLLTGQALRYLVVGLVALGVDVTLLVLLTESAGLHYLLSAALAFLCGLIVNYVLSIAWVFKYRSMSDKRVEFVVFAMVGIAGLGLLELMMWSMTELAGVNYLISKAGATVLVFSWNFLGRRFLLFRPPAAD